MSEHELINSRLLWETEEEAGKKGDIVMGLETEIKRLKAGNKELIDALQELVDLKAISEYSLYVDAGNLLDKIHEAKPEAADTKSDTENVGR